MKLLVLTLRDLASYAPRTTPEMHLVSYVKEAILLAGEVGSIANINIEAQPAAAELARFTSPITKTGIISDLRQIVP